ncbi:hypothetical protein H8E65_11405 [Candidatus Bathyarchaeota archaeon]|nr:hypothetical protein [Candidatus Bathyarchaeota archaeon]
MMIEDRRVRVSEQFVPDQIASLKVKGSEAFVKRIIDILELRLAAQPTGGPKPNDNEPGIHQFLIVSEGDLDRLEGRIF